MRQRRLPKQAHPDMVKLDYLTAIRPYVARMVSAVRSIIVPALPDLLADTQKQDAGTDADQDKAKRELDRLLKRAAAKFAQTVRPTELEDVAAQFGARTSKFQRDQLGKQARAVGIDLAAIRRTDKGVDKKIEGWVALNVDLIKSLPSRYFDDVGLHVYDAIESGTRHETLAKTLEARYEIPLNQAALIVRDQVGKLYGELNQARQENLGIRKYIWRTSNDNRVRPEHEDREGDPFSWDDPPSDGHPGYPIQCRCNAEPDFSDVLS